MAKTKYSFRGTHGLKKIADKYGINRETLRQRVTQQGMTITQAINAGDGRTTRSELLAKRKIDYIKPREQVGIKFPNLLSPTWRLALGIGVSQ